MKTFTLIYTVDDPEGDDPWPLWVKFEAPTLPEAEKQVRAWAQREGVQHWELMQPKKPYAKNVPFPLPPTLEPSDLT